MPKLILQAALANYLLFAIACNIHSDSDLNNSPVSDLEAPPQQLSCEEWIAEYKAVYLYFTQGVDTSSAVLEMATFLFENANQQVPHLYCNDSIKTLQLDLRNRLANLYMLQSDYEKALRNFQYLIPFIELKEPAQQAAIYSNIGYCYWRIQDDFNAIESLKKALQTHLKANPNPKLSFTAKDSSLLSVTYMRLADCYHTIQEYDSAKQNFTTSHQYDTYNTENFIQCAKFYIAVAADSLNPNNKLFREAHDTLRIFAQQLKLLDQNESEVLHTLARIYYVQRKHPQALHYFQKAYPKSVSVYDVKHDESIKIAVDIADIYAQQNSYQQALQVYTQVIDNLLISAKPANINVKPPKDSPIDTNIPPPTIDQMPAVKFWLLEALLHKTKCLQQTQQHALAKQYYVRISEYVQQILTYYKHDESIEQLTNTIYSTYQAGIALSLQQNDLHTAFQIAEQSKAFVLRTALQHQQALQQAHLSPDLIAEERLIQTQIAHYNLQLQQLPATEQQKYADSLFEAKQQLSTFIAKLQQSYPEYYNLQHQHLKPTTIEQVQKSIANDQLLLSHFMGNDTLYQFAISKQKANAYKIPINATLNEYATQYKETLSNDSLQADPNAEKQYTKAAYQLYKTLVEEPLRDHNTPQQQLTRLAIIPDSWLGYLSFGALLTQPDTNWQSNQMHYLAKEYAISYQYAAQLLVNQANNTQTAHNYKWAFGGMGLSYNGYNFDTLPTIMGDKKLSILPNAVTEIIAHTSYLNGKVWTEYKATKQVFKEQVNRCKIWHFSAHAFSDQTLPVQAAVILYPNDEHTTDCLLSIADIYGLKCHNELMTLSTCHSGYGQQIRGEGIMSLGRAFAYSGCKSIVMTQWSIPDGATAQVVTEFYKQLKNKQPKDIALQKAQIHYLKTTTPQLSLPNYWAAPIVVGDMKPIF